MNLKDVVRRIWFLPFLLLTACQSGSATLPTLKEIWEKIIWVGTLGFLGTQFGPETPVGFMRLMVFILVFALLFEGSRLLGLQRNTQITVSLVLSIIATVFMPKGVLAGIGVAYGTVVSFFLIGVPVFAGLYVIYLLPSTNRWLIGIKVAIIGLLLALLIIIKNFAIAGLGLP